MQVVFIINDNERINEKFRKYKKHRMFKKFYYDRTSGGIFEKCDEISTPLNIYDMKVEAVLYDKINKHYLLDGCEISSNLSEAGKAKDLVNEIKSIVSSRYNAKTGGNNNSRIFVRLNENKGVSALSRRYSTTDNPASGAFFYNFGKTYILNKTYFDSGYSDFENNIAHEVINSFIADDKKRYFYLCDDGKISSYIPNTSEGLPKDKYIDIKQATLINYSKVSENQGAGTKYMILQKVEGIEASPIAYIDTHSRKEYEEIKYGKQILWDIFAKNKNMGMTKTENYPFISFVLKSEGHVMHPNTIDEKCFFSRKKDRNTNEWIHFGGLSSSSCKQFVLEGTTLFNEIFDLLNPIKWIEEVPNKVPFNEKKMDSLQEEISVLDVINEGDKERYFSKLLAFSLKHDMRIVKEILGNLGVNNFESKFLEVSNEDFNIDVMVIAENEQKEKHIVVIENKLYANITICENRDVFEILRNREIKEEVLDDVKRELDYENISSDRLNNQLSKYYIIALALAKANQIDKANIHMLILCPKFRVESLDAERNNYHWGDAYRVFSYDELDSCMPSYDGDLKENDRRIGEIISQFKRAYYPYTQNYYDYYRRKMNNRFVRRIYELKEKNPSGDDL